MASDRKAGESGEVFATDLRFSFVQFEKLCSVQAKSFRVKIITIHFAKIELHQEKKKKKKEKKMKMSI